MKLEEGKYYKTRDGRKAKVCTIVSDELRYASPVLCLIKSGSERKVLSYYKEGNYYKSIPSPLDLVAEWGESETFLAKYNIGDIIHFTDGQKHLITGVSSDGKSVKVNNYWLSSNNDSIKMIEERK